MLTEGLHPKTVKHHLYLIDILLEKCQPFNETTVRQHLLTVLNEGNTPACVNKYIQALKKYCSYKGLKWAENIKRLREHARPKILFSDAEIEQFIDFEEQFSRGKYQREGHKYNMFWMICAFTGGRTSEICRLKVDDVDFANKLFIIHESKTGVGRTIPIAPNVEGPLQEYIKTLRGSYLFPVRFKPDVPINPAVVELDFRRRVETLGIKKHVTPYSLRHSFITRMLVDAEAPLFVVQDIVGHRKADTTRQYYHSNLRAMHKAMKKDPMIRKHLNPKQLVESIEENIKGIFSADPRFDSVEIQKAITHLYKSIKKEEKE